MPALLMTTSRPPRCDQDVAEGVLNFPELGNIGAKGADDSGQRAADSVAPVRVAIENRDLRALLNQRAAVAAPIPLAPPVMTTHFLSVLAYRSSRRVFAPQHTNGHLYGDWRNLSAACRPL